MANYQYYCGHYLKAEKTFNKAILKFTALDYSPLEKADISYLFSLSLSKMRKDALSLEYAEDALEIYKNHYKMEKCAKLHMKVGVCYSRLQNNKRAFTHYESAKELILKEGLTRYLGLLDHNIGFLKIKEGDTESGINHLQSSLQYKQKFDKSTYFTTLLLLISVHYHNDSKGLAIKNLEEGLSKIDIIPTSQLQHLELQFFRCFLLESQEEWESFVHKKLFPYLEENQELIGLANYSKILGSFYYKNTYYKKASRYYMLATDAYEKIHYLRNVN